MFAKENGFTQENGFGDYYSITACNAASTLNVFSMCYTKETGTALLLEQGFDILINVPDKWIDKSDATVYDLDPALNSMINYYEKKENKKIFRGKFGYSASWLGYKQGADLEETYFIDAVESPTFDEHYVNEINSTQTTHIVHDTYDGKLKPKNNSEIIKQNRADYYIPKQENN